QIAADTAVLAYSLDNIDVEMVVGEDGRLHIAERRQVAIQEGVMYGGYREISWLYLDGVGDVSLAEGDAVFTFVPDDAPLCDYCAQIMTEARYSQWAQYSEWQDRVTISDDWAGQTAVRWQFPPLVKGETTTFTLEYTVDGAISVNEDNQRLSWTVVPGYETAVGETAVHLQLPGDMGLEDIAIEGGAAKREGGAILITPEQPPQADEAWQIAIDLPPEATTAVKPDWQSDLETAYVQAEAARARQAQRELTWLVVKIVTAVFALLGLLVGWYLWGSRKAREIMGNYRTLPPSDLSPGIVAYLVDKEATARSALASLLHLASLGWIRVNPGQTLTLQRVREGLVTSGQEVTTPDGRHVKAPDHAATLYNALLPAMPRGEAIPLSAITPAFQKVLPKMYAAMGGEMAAHFYGDGRLSEDGRQTKRDQLARFMPMLGLAGSAIFAFSMISGQRSRPFGSFDAPNPFVMIVGFFGPFFLGIILAQYLSRPKSALTKLGAKEAARWRGFGAYLQEIQKYGSLEEAQAILERYFAYAVALGVDERFVAEVKALGGRIPGWIGGGELDDGRSWQNESISTTTAVPRWRQLVQQGSWRPRPAAPATTAAPPTPSAPGLEMLSGRLTDSLSSASQRMTTMLNTAIGVADGDAKNGQPVKVTLRTGGRKVEMEWQPGTSADKMVGEIMRKAEATRPPRPASGSGSGGYRGGGSSGGFGGGSRSSGRRSGRSSSRSSGSRRSGGGGRRGFR
ncbi:MAG: DUF2207 domain-containing protein, partial [Chloroflexi bacterium]|nr:DUF2207 domain-containing protein [Chloroflexota bacterium]